MTLDQEIFMDQSHPYIALGGLELTETLLGLIPLPCLDHLFTPKSIPAKRHQKRHNNGDFFGSSNVIISLSEGDNSFLEIGWLPQQKEKKITGHIVMRHFKCFWCGLSVHGGDKPKL